MNFPRVFGMILDIHPVQLFIDTLKNPSREPSLRRCSLADLEARITELAGQLNAATYRWLTLIGEFDRRQGWADGSLHSCAHWLNFKCGLDLGAAREKVRVASALPGVPKIAAAMKRGELSYSKVRALTRVATPATEENLLMIALHGTAYHVEKVVRLFRRAQEAEELSREAQQQAGRAVEYWYDTDGSLVLKARLPALSGGLLVKALEVALEAVPATQLNVEFAEEQPVSYASRRADALARALRPGAPRIASKWWCMSMPRLSRSRPPDAATSSTGPPCRPRRCAVWPATRA